jgi:hypothetical protein
MRASSFILPWGFDIPKLFIKETNAPKIIKQECKKKFLTHENLEFLNAAELSYK